MLDGNLTPLLTSVSPKAKSFFFRSSHTCFRFHVPAVVISIERSCADLFVDKFFRSDPQMTKVNFNNVKNKAVQVTAPLGKSLEIWSGFGHLCSTLLVLNNLYVYLTLPG